jgi:hypothetical protein
VASNSISGDLLQHSMEQIDKLTTTLSRRLMPTDFREALGWAAFLWTSCPAYRQAIIRGISYFMTEVEVSAAEGVDGKLEEIRNAKQLLNRNFASTDMAMKALQEAVGFGGSCVYLFFPVIRTLTCSCGFTSPVEAAMREYDVKFALDKGHYHGKCPSCRRAVTFELSEARYRDEAHRAQLRLVPLSICRMKYNPISGERRLFVDCAQWEDVAKLVRDGDPLIHADTPREFIDSARLRCEMEMDDNSFYYLGFHDASIIDMNLGGWSLPPFFYAFSDVLAIMLLQHYNTTILSDYIPPLRYVAPPPTVGVARSLGNDQPFDPTHAMTNSFADFRTKVTSLIRTLKEDPTKIGVAPYPIQFGYLGLEGGQLLSVELLQHYNDSLMYNMGIPPEFYRGGIQAQVATPSHYGFALFERFWAGFVSNVNRMYQWLYDQLQKAEHWPDMYVNLVPPVRFADPSMLPILHQRVQEGELSNDTFNRLIGANTQYERRMAESEQRDREARFMSQDRRNQRKEIVSALLGDASPDMQAYMQLQQPAPAPGMPAGAPAGAAAVPAGPAPTPQAMTAPAGSPAAAVNPAEKQVVDRVMTSARSAAQQISTYPMAERIQLLREMDAQDPAFRGMVEQALTDLENEARKQGLAQSRGQQ